MAGQSLMSDFYCEYIISGQTPVEVVYETLLVLAFHHTKPFFEHHVVIIPKQHIESLSHYPANSELNQDFFEAIKYVTHQFEQRFRGCRISSNVGSYQSAKHLHWYVHFGQRIRNEDGSLIAH